MSRPGHGLLAPRIYHRWRKVRAALLRERLWCEVCLREGRKRRAEEVDHIKPLHLGGAVLDIENLCVICTGCHKEKTRGEMAELWRLRPALNEDGLPAWRDKLPAGVPR